VPYDGVVVIDKPAGMTSAGVVAAVKRALGGVKAGHSGTLDPDATGILICCLGAATRLARFLMQAPKTYETVLVLGVETETQDAGGRVTAVRSTTELTADAIRRAAAGFEGAIAQVPPAFSALKHQGVPLYRLARQGRAVTKPARPVTIHRLSVQGVDLPRVHLEVVCSAGTYVRTLCADLGRALGCGGHMARLRRTASAGFVIDDALPLEAFQALVRQGRADACIVPMGRALRDMPAVAVDGATARRIAGGQRLTAGQIGPPPGDGPIQVVAGGRVLAIVEYNRAAGRYDYACVLPYQP
jgi:tRNA pseudouridine55 synthase